RATDFPWYKSAYLRWTYGRLAQRADHIVTVSEFSRQDIVRKLAVPPERVTVISMGLREDLLRQIDAVAEPKIKIARPYVLSVAGAYPHKRLHTLIAAFEMMAARKPDLELVLAGTHTGTTSAIRALRERVSASAFSSRIQLRS